MTAERNKPAASNGVLKKLVCNGENNIEIAHCAANRVLSQQPVNGLANLTRFESVSRVQH
jgi:hypothetical protein